MSVISIDDLVPGVMVPLRATLTARQFSQMQKLRKLKVVEDGSGEQLQITMVAAPAKMAFPGPQPTVLRTNRAPVPIAFTMGGPWRFSNGTSESLVYSADSTVGAGPQGRTGFIRQTVTNAKTGGGSGWVYEDGTGSGAAGDVWSAGMWVRFATATTVTPRFTMFWIGIPVASITGADVVAPANTWTYLTVNGLTATAEFDQLQFWAGVAGVVPPGGWYDATNLIFEQGPTVGDYFDGSFADTPTLIYEWFGLENSSKSTVSSPAPAREGS
jgi:hypothetical protein